MSQQVGTGKYERLLARCQGLEPIPTAEAHLYSTPWSAPPCRRFGQLRLCRSLMGKRLHHEAQ